MWETKKKKVEVKLTKGVLWTGIKILRIGNSMAKKGTRRIGPMEKKKG